MDRLIRKRISNHEILDYFGGQCSIFMYSDIAECTDISQLFGKYDKCFLLYNNRPRSGHWCLLMRYPDRFLFFDSFGYKPDEELGKIPQAIRRMHRMCYPVVLKLLRQSGKRIFFNQYQLQESKRGVNTCGRHCIVRAAYPGLRTDDYARILTSSELSPDVIVTLLTRDI